MSPPYCLCSAVPGLVFACSEGSDVGEIADRVARLLDEKATIRMFCLTGIGGRVSGILATTAAAAKILVIDGCPQDCAKRTLAQAGFVDILHLRLSDLGLKKGESSVNEQSLQWVTQRAVQLLRRRAE